MDQAQQCINELRLSGKHAIAQKSMSIYQEQCVKTQKLAFEYEGLYKRFIEKEAKAKVAEGIKKGGIYKYDSEEDNSEMNVSIKDIQMNPLLSNEQRITRVEAEV